MTTRTVLKCMVQLCEGCLPCGAASLQNHCVDAAAEGCPQVRVPGQPTRPESWGFPPSPHPTHQAPTMWTSGLEISVP